jgi:hypothetical protein
MEKSQISFTSTLDHPVESQPDHREPSIIESIATATEKDQNPIEQNEKSSKPQLSEEEQKKIQKKEARARVLTFIGLQLSLFLAALDG